MKNSIQTTAKESADPQPTAITDVLNLADIQRFQDLFADVHGVASLITDPKGQPITQPSNFTRLCADIIRKTEKGRANCFQSDAVIGRYHPTGPLTQPCLSCGLWDAGVSITVEGKHIANWLIGQVRNKEVDEEQYLQYADKIGADKAAFKAALKEVPVMSEARFRKIADLLFILANELSEKAFSNWQLKNQVAENEKINALLLEREENLSTTLLSIGDGVISTDKNGLVVKMNPIAEKLCGWTLADAAGRPLSEVFHIVNADTRKRVANPVHLVLQSGNIVGLANHTVLVSKNGAEYQIADSAAPIKNKNGDISGVVLVFSDVTEQYAAEKQIRVDKVRFKHLLEHLEAGIVVHAADTSVIQNNPRACILLGLSNDEMRGKTSNDATWKFVDEAGVPLTPESYPVNQIIATQKPLKNQILGICQPDNKPIVWALTNGFPAFDSKGKLTEITISFIDISPRKKAEKALRRSEAFKSKMVAHIGDVIVIIDKHGIHKYKSPNITKLFGWKPEELVGRSTWENIHPDDLERGKQLIASIQTIPNAATTGELRYKHKDGKYVWIEVKIINMLQDNDIQGFLGNYHDITERKQFNEKLLAAKEKAEVSESRFKSLFQNMSNSASLYTVIYNEQGIPCDYRFLEINAAYEKSIGCSAADIIGKTILEVFPATEVFWLDTFKEVVLKQESTSIENYSKEVDKYFELIVYIPQEGQIAMLGSDISERKKAELELVVAKEKAEESDRLKSAFLANMSHEIRTPMNGILGFADLLRQPDLTDERQQSYIQIIKKSGVRMLNIINDIIDISKIEAGLMKLDINESNVNKQFEYIYTFFKPEAQAKGLKLRLISTLPTAEVNIRTDREKVYAILTNLVKNAVKHTHEGSIELGYELKTGNGSPQLEFFVKDTGIGIPKDRQEAIFHRFVQADIADKMAYQGAGLGLSISKAYVEMLGGKIWVDSEEGRGAAFFFTLPYNTEALVERLDRPISPSVKTDNVRKLTILIAEDDEVSQILLEKTVDLFAKTIIKVDNGLKTVEACRNNPDIDLVLMDIQMPAMNGYEATRQIRLFNKEVVIIAQTAYGLTSDRKKSIEAGCNDYISKPINAAHLRAMIQKHFSK